MGHTSEQKIPNQWVSTTCGYCSVGCGMFIGVKDGRAVSVRGNPDHPVNAGKLCPKGLSEHYTLEASNRARYPLLRNKRGKLIRIGWDEALTKADVILLIGANIADNHPILCQYLEANPGMKLIVADPRVTKTAMMADLYLPLKPRSDIALLNGMIHILIANNLVDREYIAAHTTGFDQLEESVRKYTPDTVSQLTGLTPAQIYKGALIYGKAKAPFIGWTMGVNHSTKGPETVNVINNLALITGNVGKPGASPFSITGQCNAMGTREAGFTSSLPGYRKFESATDREELAAFWGIDRQRIPTSRGWAYPDIIEGAVSKKIRALWVIATNPVVSFPNLGVLQQSLDSLDFLVVQDGFHPTPTTEVADLVLPAAIWGEKEGTYTNSERRVSKVNRAVQPPGEARTD